VSRNASAIVWHDGPRTQLRHLFDLADDSADENDGYIELGRVLVAVDDGDEIVGYAQLLPTARGNAIELRSIAVVPGLQRRGIGRALVDRVLAVGRSEGARAVTVTTATADVDNIRFYLRCGFRASSIEQNAFTEARGYPPGLEADGIAVRDGITFTFAFGANDPGS
jgi:GNAT superfamily N-acetyltransferase